MGITIHTFVHVTKEGKDAVDWPAGEVDDRHGIRAKHHLNAGGPIIHVHGESIGGGHGLRGAHREKSQRTFLLGNVH